MTDPSSLSGASLPGAPDFPGSAAGRPLAVPSGAAVTPPATGRSSGDGKGTTMVNTLALKTFAANIESLVADGGPFRANLSDVHSVLTRSGGFHSAVALDSAVNGSGGLVDGTAQTLSNTIDAIENLAEQLRLVAGRYEKAEDLNNMSAADFGSYFGTAGGVINSLNGSGGSGGGSAGGGSAGGGSAGGGSASGGSAGGGSAGGGSAGGGSAGASSGGGAGGTNGGNTSAK